MIGNGRLSLSDQWLLALANRADPGKRIDDVFEPPTFQQFIPQAWHVVEKRPFVGNWHIDAVAEHLVAVTSGEIKKLLINMPPRHTKSLLTCVLWPAWAWIVNSSLSWLFASYSWNFAKRDAVKTRRLIDSSWYQANYGHLYDWSPDQNEKMRYDNSRGGYRISTSVGGTSMGDGADVRVIDDPIKPEDAESDNIRGAVNAWWANTWSTRVNDPKTAVEVIVMQRLHERDLSGYLLAEVGGYDHLMLPMRFEPDRKCYTSINFSDPRKTPGELLNPPRFGEEDVKDLENKLSTSASGQLQQNPSPATGEIFKKYWWSYWVPEGMVKPDPVLVRLEDGTWRNLPIVTLPVTFDESIQSWDMTFKDTKGTDFVCGQVWGKHGAMYFLIDQILKRLDFNNTKTAVKQLSSQYPNAVAKLIEDKANGPAIMNSLRADIHGMIPVQPYGNKIARAKAVTPVCQSGNVVLPHPQVAPWVKHLIDELAKFPKAQNDDQVDALSQALARWLVVGEYTWVR